MDDLNPGAEPNGDLRARLGLALREALKARDKVATSALRTALAAIANAEAVPAATPPAGTAGSPYVAGTAVGVGGAEADRRILSDAEIGAIVRSEITERHAAAAQYEQAGHADRAARLRREADVLSSAVDVGRP
jgi:uncharacterized protein YqeY